jgi:hypothetical protein
VKEMEMNEVEEDEIDVPVQVLYKLLQKCKKRDVLVSKKLVKRIGHLQRYKKEGDKKQKKLQAILLHFFERHKALKEKNDLKEPNLKYNVSLGVTESGQLDRK